MTLSGQRALVTGAASGIGRATAIALADAGAFVICADIADANPTAAEITGKASMVDVTDPASVTALFAKAGKLDIVVNGMSHVRDDARSV